MPGKPMLVIPQLRKSILSTDLRIIPSLPLHWFPTTKFDSDSFHHAMISQPGLDAILGFEILESTMRLADLLAQSGSGDKYFSNDLFKPALWRLFCVAALCRIIPDSVQVCWYITNNINIL